MLLDTVFILCLSRLESFLSPHIYKLTNSATLWIAEGHTGCLACESR